MRSAEPTTKAFILSILAAAAALSFGCETPGILLAPGRPKASDSEQLDLDGDPTPADPSEEVPSNETATPLSFFVPSIEAIKALSGSEDGFGGDLGGLDGADNICQQVAARVGAGHKTWRAFLSATAGPDGNPVNAIERIGDGPWYDANGRLIAQDRQGLLSERPAGDPQVVDDLPDENGQSLKRLGDANEILTGSDANGMLSSPDPAATCQDWTSSVGPGSVQRVMAGHCWPEEAASSWIEARTVPGCAPGINLVDDGSRSGNCVGCSGGYGAFYCFALTP